MNSLTHLQQVLADRRRRGEHRTIYKNLDPLDRREARNTNLDGGALSGGSGRLYIPDHYRDIQYTAKWYTIYQAVKDMQLVPGRSILLGLKKTAEDRVEELEETLDSIGQFEDCKDEAMRDKYNSRIDIIRWKIKYFKRTILDAQEMLDMHDVESMYIDLPVGQDDWWVPLK
ncbi:hypothetical protein TWF718_002824 [Orbilia javanica]|uniref:Uncharacterized protein n=1 Tax=Orbilia javanica TaxID=47235 RepID=A0AAN8MIZ8_9PEZI